MPTSASHVCTQTYSCIRATMLSYCITVKAPPAHPPHVHGRTVLPAAETQLWRSVPTGDDGWGHVSPGTPVRPCEPKICKFHLAVTRVQQVVRFQILKLKFEGNKGQRRTKSWTAVGVDEGASYCCGSTLRRAKNVLIQTST